MRDAYLAADAAVIAIVDEINKEAAEMQAQAQEAASLIKTDALFEIAAEETKSLAVADAEAN